MGANYDNTLVIKEKETLMQLEKWSLIEESILRQKSRAQWIQLGDSNSKYFAAVMKERCHRKQIKELKSLQGGQLLSDPNELKEEIVSFYKGLMGTSNSTLKAVNKITMSKGPKLNHEQQILLCAPVTDQEIAEGLEAIGNDKSPGLDGYNAYFYKGMENCWS